MAHNDIKDILKSRIAEIQGFLQESDSERDKLVNHLGEIDRSTERAHYELGLAERALIVLEDDTNVAMPATPPGAMGKVAGMDMHISHGTVGSAVGKYPN